MIYAIRSVINGRPLAICNRQSNMFHNLNTQISERLGDHNYNRPTYEELI